MIIIQLLFEFTKMDVIQYGLEQMACMILHLVIVFGIYLPKITKGDRRSLSNFLLSVAVIILFVFLFVVIRDFIYDTFVFNK